MCAITLNPFGVVNDSIEVLFHATPYGGGNVTLDHDVISHDSRFHEVSPTSLTLKHVPAEMKVRSLIKSM